MQSALKELPIDTSTLSGLLKRGCVYVDKTQELYPLLSRGKYYFVARPRRFGKSLLVSTLKEIFLGNKELFKGLWLYDSDYEWQTYPVIHLDFGAIAHSTLEEFKTELARELFEQGKSYGVVLNEALPFQSMLTGLLKGLGGKENTVLLIDEYDKPMLDHLHNLPIAKEMRDILGGFFSTVKGLDAYWRFVFLTGVSKFSKTSVFSGLNNLNDLSEDPKAATLLGYTDEELKHYFTRHVEAFAQKKGVSASHIWDELKKWYNGYCFSTDESLPKVYNPFSLMYALHKQEFANYWFKSATPTFLINLIKKQQRPEMNFSDSRVGSGGFDSFELDKIEILPVLYQTGYLTIREYVSKTRIYKLGYRNQEVAMSMAEHLLAAFAYTEKTTVESSISFIQEALEANDVPRFAAVLQSLFANIPAKLHIAEERYYHSLLQMICNLLGLEADSEIATSKDIIDMVIEMPERIFVMEFKLGKSAQEAMSQIKSKHYADKFRLKQKPITMAGLSFNRTEDGLAVESVQERSRGLGLQPYTYR